jgi:hypothetical protein
LNENNEKTQEEKTTKNDENEEIDIKLHNIIHEIILIEKIIDFN